MKARFRPAILLAVALVVVCGYASGAIAAAPPKSKPHTHAEHEGHAGHDHDHQHLCEEDIELPTDFASAVQRIEDCRETIKAEIEAGHLEELHHPLDEATIILGKLMPLARDSGVPKSKWQEVNLVAKDLKKRLGALHTSIDKQQPTDYSKVAPPIDADVRRLQAVAGSLPSTAKRPQTSR
jgi:hypothetical protein